MLAKALGVNQLLVVVNKLDATDPPWSEERYEAVKAEVGPFLARTGFRPKKVCWRAIGCEWPRLAVQFLFFIDRNANFAVSFVGSFQWDGRVRGNSLGSHGRCCRIPAFSPPVAWSATAIKESP